MSTAEERGAGHAPHATLHGYVIGFVLSVILTAIPFWLVMTGALGSGRTTVIVIMAFATVQIFVHMICFLHMTPRVEGGWSLTALGFTVTLVVITLVGSVWVMYHLNTNMMPRGGDTSQLP
jgi:cytochrome o ubiquinol oxidase operon protein cyoD